MSILERAARAEKRNLCTCRETAIASRHKTTAIDRLISQPTPPRSRPVERELAPYGPVAVRSERQPAAAATAAAASGTSIPERHSTEGAKAHVPTRDAPARPIFERPTLTEYGARRGDPWMSDKRKTLLPPHPYIAQLAAIDPTKGCRAASEEDCNLSRTHQMILIECYESTGADAKLKPIRPTALPTRYTILHALRV
jgi:hypothetical protein